MYNIWGSPLVFLFFFKDSNLIFWQIQMPYILLLILHDMKTMGFLLVFYALPKALTSASPQAESWKNLKIYLCHFLLSNIDLSSESACLQMVVYLWVHFSFSFFFVLVCICYLWHHWVLQELLSYKKSKRLYLLAFHLSEFCNYKKILYRQLFIFEDQKLFIFFKILLDKLNKLLHLCR